MEEEKFVKSGTSVIRTSLCSETRNPKPSSSQEWLQRLVEGLESGGAHNLRDEVGGELRLTVDHVALSSFFFITLEPRVE